MARGGYRKPSKPAPVAGPGNLARRTDGKPGQKLAAPTGMAYGAHQDLLNQEQAAPMSVDMGAPSAQPATGGAAPTAAPFQGLGLDAPSTRPDEPVTHGVPIGPGAGPEALSFQPNPGMQPSGAMTQLLQKYSATDTTGLLAQLYQAAAQKGV